MIERIERSVNKVIAKYMAEVRDMNSLEERMFIEQLEKYFTKQSEWEQDFKEARGK